MSFLSKQIKQPSLNQNPRRQEGVVIIVALFVVALVATMSYFMMSRLMRDTQRTTLVVRNAQAEFYAQGSVAWALDQLRNDWEQQKPDKLIDLIPIQSSLSEMNGYKIQSTIYDMQARFNLNNLSTQEGQAVFLRLLQLIEPKLAPAEAQGIVRAAIDWITPGTVQNELSKHYQSLPVPYRPAHRFMQSPTELRLVKGMTPALSNALQPYVTALPVTTKVNVQTASPIILAALTPNMPMEAARVIEHLRQQKPFLNPKDFTELDVVKNHPIKPEAITTVSQYFLVETKVSIEKQTAVIYTLMERAVKERKAVLNILWQSKGVW